MAETIGLAKRHGVLIGAHPSYPDREHFGRVTLDMDLSDLMESVVEQIGTLANLVDEMGGGLHHIKAHGALYNDLAKGGDMAVGYLEVVAPYKKSVMLYSPCGSVFTAMASDAGFSVWEEAFVDRAYNPDGSLVSRKRTGSLLTSPEEVKYQLQEMVLHGRVRCSDGSYWPIEAQTYCLHGDTPNAPEILTYLSETLPEERIRIRK